MRHRLLKFSGMLAIICLTATLPSGLFGADAKPEPVKSAQLLGSWVRTNVADIDGLEFTKDGKVLVYMGGGNEALSGEYALRDDGRLSLNLGGLADFFVPAMAGDQLHLKQPDSGYVSQYRKLKPGETVAAAIAAQKEADKKAIEARNASLPEFLKRQDLVLTYTGVGPEAPGPCAIEFAPNGASFTGRAVYDGKPPRMEPASALIHNSDNPADKSSVVVVLGSADANQPGNHTQITFHPVGTGPDIALTAQVNFGAMFNTAPNGTATIKADPNARKDILEKFKSEVARLEALKAPVIALLKEYVVLKGTSQSQLPGEKEGFADQFTLSHNPQNNTWVGQGQIVNKATGATETFPALAGVAIVNEKPAIQIISQKRVYQFADIDAAGGKLTGAWQMPQNPANHAAALAIATAVDAKGRDELFTARKNALKQMPANTVFHAVLDDLHANGNQPPNPIAMTLTIAADGAITGKADYPMIGCTMTIAGKEVDTPQGPQLQLHYSGGQANPGAWADVANYTKAVEQEAFSLSAEGDATGPIRLSGLCLTKPGYAPIAVQLIPYADKDKAALLETLNGAHFKVTTPKGSGPDDILEFTVDAATKKVTGKLTAGGTHINNAVGSTFTGDVEGQDDCVKLTMPIMRPVDKKAVYAYTVVIMPTDAGLYLNGSVYNITQGANHPVGHWDAVQIKP